MYHVTIISLKHGFHLSPHAECSKKKSVNVTLHTSKLSLGPMKLSKDINKSGLKIFKQISSVTVGFACEIELIPSKYVNITRT